MSYRDYFHPDRNSPDGRSGIEAGATAGVQIGSMFGPAGAAIGAFVGGALGIGSSSGARRRARRRATRESYQFVGDVYNYRVESTRAIGEQYESELSFLNARTAASGTSANIDAQIGELVTERDAELANLNAEVAEFRQGESYEWFMKDYERVTGIQTTRMGGGRGEDTFTNTYSMGREGYNSGRYAFTEEQRGNLRSLTTTSFSGMDETRLYQQYAERVAPTVEWYERRTFGGEEGMTAYNEYMDARIEAANIWYDREIALLNERRQAQAEQQRIDDNMRGGR